MASGGEITVCLIDRSQKFFKHKLVIYREGAIEALAQHLKILLR